MTISSETLLSALRWRYATKKFDATRKIPAETWDAIEESLVLTPSSFGIQPWKFLVITDPGVRANLLPESWHQSQVTDASHLVVLTARIDVEATDINEWIDCMVAAQGSTHEAVAPLKGVIEGFAQAMSQDERHAWNLRQLYIALGQLMASASLLGLDACPMEGISRSGYDKVLHLDGTGYGTVVACAIGYRAADDRYAEVPKARYDRSRVIRRI